MLEWQYEAREQENAQQNQGAAPKNSPAGRGGSTADGDKLDRGVIRIVGVHGKFLSALSMAADGQVGPFIYTTSVVFQGTKKMRVTVL
jgi:hypothetical protein